MYVYSIRLQTINFYKQYAFKIKSILMPLYFKHILTKTKSNYTTLHLSFYEYYISKLQQLFYKINV